ncbi:SCO-spondin-like isoform X5 [Haliotis rubra]|uniref:SCO-spondin-like isoform X5 n=1 Tax=Haliotis rubra TaxID=36100 RepID=UPI001EE5B3B2|nr:SCO-spondin-like isoform X5 [Haliotis rubra]
MAGSLPNDGRLSVTVDNQVQRLTIINAQLSDAATYSFTIAGQSRSATITVIAGVLTWTGSQTRTIGGTATITVNLVNGNCNLGTWTRNGGVVSTGGRISYTRSGSCVSHTLTITNVQLSDQGTYQFTYNGQQVSSVLTVSTSAAPVSGGFSAWTPWSQPPCSVTCGTGAAKTVFRSRTCDNPAPLNGGANCTGQFVENVVTNCGLVGCPVNGGVTQWSTWNSGSVTCPQTCGTSAQKITERRRTCTSPTPLNGGTFCGETLLEIRTESCGLTNACPSVVNGGVTEWSSWTNPGCSVSCGTSATKLIQRFRSCTNPPPSAGGADCVENLSDNTMVNCGLTGCPVNGGVNQWGQWSSATCTATCGSTSTYQATRTRQCNNPIPANGGSFCTQPLSETTFLSCGLPACPVNGGLTQWTQWSGPACSVTCGSAATRTLTRTRSCTNPVPHFGGSDCTGQGNTFDSEVRSCGLSECPIDGGLTQWTQWSVPACSVTCGSAASRTVTRTRSCTNPVPQFGGSDCTGQGNTFDSEVRSCGFSQCPINGGLTQWTQWSIPACSVTCGSAASRTVTRTRSCSNPVPQLGGSDCTGQGNTFDSEVRSCGLTPCPTDGGLSTWTQWSVPQCSVTCGQSATRTVTRTRSCTNPVPSDGGRDCTGLGDTFETEQRSCGLNPCPIDGGVTQWTQWNDPACSVTCGAFASKTVTRTRSCTSPTPQFGGRVCTETLFENTVRNCNLAACAVNGGISLWTEWVVPQCLLTCGTSLTETATRQRFCNSPPPSNGGLNCTESRVDTQVRSCGLSSCPVNGGVSQWTTWIESGCGATCGVSIFRTATRQRFCNNPFPAFGGRNCSESFSQTETRNCGFSPCPSMYTKCPSRLCNLPGWSWSSVTHACKRPLTGSGGQTR